MPLEKTNNHNLLELAWQLSTEEIISLYHELLFYQMLSLMLMNKLGRLTIPAHSEKIFREYSQELRASLESSYLPDLMAEIQEQIIQIWSK
jgi:hypothetical protein